MLSKSHLEYLWRMRSKGLSEQTKAELLKPSGKGGQPTNRDYVQAVAKLSTYQRRHEGVVFDETYSYKDILNGLSKAERFRLWFYTPCLARRFDELTAAEREALLTDPDWTLTEKIKGVRAVLVVCEGEAHLYSRNYSEEDCHCPDYAKKVLPMPIINEGVVYCADVILRLADNISVADELRRFGVTDVSTPIEQMCGLLAVEPAQAVHIQKEALKSFGRPLVELVLIAPLHFNGTPYINGTLGTMEAAYDDCLNYGARLGFNIKPYKRLQCASKIEKEVFIASCLKSGLDGVVAHYAKGRYCTTEPRSKTSYVKIKRAIGESGGLGDTIDAYVTGFRLGGERISHVVCSVDVDVNGRRFTQIIATAPVSAEDSKAMTVEGMDGYAPVWTADETKVVSLSFDYKHIVVELDGGGLNGKRQLISPRIVRFRRDKLASECVYSKEFIDGQVRTVDGDSIKKTLM